MDRRPPRAAGRRGRLAESVAGKGTFLVSLPQRCREGLSPSPGYAARMADTSSPHVPAIVASLLVPGEIAVITALLPADPGRSSCLLLIQPAFRRGITARWACSRAP
ncbi:hypothetical protein A0U93_15365 [Neoasaia chiangmaiensis]|uniref:Uncharacterized protein n=1 Tax=Neoasaia chiangmaiensis TaxID=320497 RepID=A0A1U9KTE2_9PROT|nr:hypothetical protein A0U93_15365 [Neoasaia chiangmaiensis]